MIRNEDIKPVLNLKWYQNQDFYSDGDVEDEIIRLISENKEEDYSKAIREHMSWPVYYHLTKLRKNIVAWYPFKKEASVLEIGCGMGAITGTLCDKCEKVTAVELSKRRASAAQLRCRDKDNLEIIVGNLNDIEFDEKFDYITLIGVLEYQGKYTDSQNPYIDFLKKIKGLLKEDGKLLIAIENKYGLKYWCGAPEDHTGVPFDGMNQYCLGQKAAQTFSREELNEIVKESGFSDTYFYYPMPDYKLPTVIYSEKYLPKNEVDSNIMFYSYPDNTTLIADESSIYHDVIKNHVFEFFANSFLVECSLKKDQGERVIYAVNSNERQKELECITLISDKHKVYKKTTASHRTTICENMESLRTNGVKTLPFERNDDGIAMDFMDCELLSDEITDAIHNKNLARAYELLDLLYADILKSSEPSSQNILYQLNLAKPGVDPDFGVVLKKGYLDLIARNAFLQDNELLWFDQEWMLPDVPAGFILFRNLLELYGSYSWLNQMLPLQELLVHFHIENQVEYFVRLNSLFATSVLDTDHINSSKIVRDIPGDRYISNVSKLLHK